MLTKIGRQSLPPVLRYLNAVNPAHVRAGSSEAAADLVLCERVMHAVSVVAIGLFVSLLILFK